LSEHAIKIQPAFEENSGQEESVFNLSESSGGVHSNTQTNPFERRFSNPIDILSDIVSMSSKGTRHRKQTMENSTQTAAVELSDKSTHTEIVWSHANSDCMPCTHPLGDPQQSRHETTGIDQAWPNYCSESNAFDGVWILTNENPGISSFLHRLEIEGSRVTDSTGNVTFLKRHPITRVTTYEGGILTVEGNSMVRMGKSGFCATYQRVDVEFDEDESDLT